MLRRSLLTAAIAAPGLMLGGRAIACGTPIIQGISDGSGSSVPPVGRVPRGGVVKPRAKFDPWGGKGPSTQSCDGGGYTQPYLTAEQWWAVLYNSYSVYAGARPLPYGTAQISGPQDPLLTAMRTPNGYLDHNDIASTLEILGATAAAAGYVTGGPRGAAAGAVWGLAATVAIVVIDTTAVYLSHRQRALDANQSYNPSELFYLNGQLQAYVPNTGSYVIPSIAAPTGGGGGSFCIPTYLLL